ncbi:hypothetical protein GCM10023185_12300 [Hymenobacter saemangeumensis]|uniref:Lipoprotein n=1 Tax=Hymenobacter saemangeumensis TaxID=1084522 RepID=A0ABP8I6P2_9BACT
MKHAYYCLALSVVLLSACGKEDPDPVDQLPPATQTGANTFGCLVNGQPWTPRGNNGTSNYTVSYDIFPDGGLLEIVAYRIYGTGPDDFQSLSLWTKELHGIGTRSFQNTQNSIARFNEQRRNCVWRSRDSTTTYRRGQLTITRLDLQAGVVSGTFAFTMYKPGCDSIRVTEGRFDRKL